MDLFTFALFVFLAACAFLGWRQEGHPLGQAFHAPDGHKRNDVIIKREIYEREIAGKFNVEYCLDDRDRVVALWRLLGLTCLQVDYGTF